MVENHDRAGGIFDLLTEENQMRLFTGLSKSYDDLCEWERALICVEKAEALSLKMKLSANIMRRHQETHILILLTLQRGKEALAFSAKMLPDYAANLLPDDPDIRRKCLSSINTPSPASEPKTAPLTSALWMQQQHSLKP